MLYEYKLQIIHLFFFKRAWAEIWTLDLPVYLVDPSLRARPLGHGDPYRKFVGKLRAQFEQITTQKVIIKGREKDTNGDSTKF